MTGDDLARTAGRGCGYTLAALILAATGFCLALSALILVRALAEALQ